MRKAPVVPAHTVTYFVPGETCGDPTLGDLILVRDNAWTAKVIRFGERLRLRKADRIFAAVNHAMTVVEEGESPVVQQMTGTGGVLTPLSDFEDATYAVVHCTRATSTQRVAAQAAARWYVGVPYGWGSIVSDGLYLLTGLPVGLSLGQSVVCSADASTAQRCLGFVPAKPDIAVLPSDLARWFDVRLPTVTL